VRFAAVGWAADCGVGRELTDAVANLPFVGVFAMTHAKKRNRFDLVPEAVRFISHGRELRTEMSEFLSKFRPDIVMTWEWPGSWDFPALWRTRGVRWVNVVHWDWFPAERLAELRLATLIAPNETCRHGLKHRYALDSTVLSIPLDIRGYNFRKRGRALKFGLIYGFGGPSDRRSLKEVLDAWVSLKGRPDLVVRSQEFPKEFRQTPGVTLEVVNKWHPSELYQDLDVAVQPSKFEGVGLSLLEAQACGVPVVTVDAEPMRTIAPDLLVGVSATFHVATMKGHQIQASSPSVHSIIEMVSMLEKTDLGRLSEKARARAEIFSWGRLKDGWMSFLSALGQG